MWPSCLSVTLGNKCFVMWQLNDIEIGVNCLLDDGCIILLFLILVSLVLRSSVLLNQPYDYWIYCAVTKLLFDGRFCWRVPFQCVVLTEEMLILVGKCIWTRKIGLWIWSSSVLCNPASPKGNHSSQGISKIRVSKRMGGTYQFLKCCPIGKKLQR